MRTFTASQLISWLWLIWIVNWAISARFVKKPAQPETAWSRLEHLALLAIGIVLIYAQSWHMGLLDHRFLIQSFAVDCAAVLLTVLGMVLACWARVHIGQYWSASVSLKSDHRIIQTGPYTYIRHPIYTGILISFAGGVLVNGQYRGILGFAVITAAILLKAAREEALLTRAFGADYRDYRQHTGLLLPKIP